jgi:excisionase family DNA binding protein
MNLEVEHARDRYVTDKNYIGDNRRQQGIRRGVVNTGWEPPVKRTPCSSDRTELEKPETLSVPEAGRVVGLGKNASYDAARRGELPVLRFGRILRVPRAALDRMLGK